MAPFNDRPLKRIRLSLGGARSASSAEPSQQSRENDEPSPSIPPPTNWTEPALAAPRPSFAFEPPIMQRAGVFQHTLPIGTRPTDKIRVKEKATGARRWVEAQYAHDYIIDDTQWGENGDGDLAESLRSRARGTAANNTRSAILRSQEQAAAAETESPTPNRVATPAKEASQPPARGSSQPSGKDSSQPPVKNASQPPAKDSSQPPADLPRTRKGKQTAVEPTPDPATPTGSGESKPDLPTDPDPTGPFYDAFRSVFDEVRERPELTPAVAVIQSALREDAELAAIVRSIQESNNELALETRAKLNKKLRAIKKNYHATHLKAPSASSAKPTNGQVTPQKRPADDDDEMDEEMDEDNGNASSPLSSVDENLVADGPPSEPPQSEPPQPNGTPAVQEVREPSDLGKQLLWERNQALKERDTIMLDDYHQRTLPESGVRPKPPGVYAGTKRPPHPLLDMAPTKRLKPDIQLAQDEARAIESERLARATGKEGKAAKIKHSPVKNNRQPTAGVSGPNRLAAWGGTDETSDASDNVDYCVACNGDGMLLCCDGCERSFHFDCLDPPLPSYEPPESGWFCFACLAFRESQGQPRPGLFGALESKLDTTNPRAFALPHWLRSYFEGVSTDRRDGKFVEAKQKPPPVTRGRAANEEDADLQKPTRVGVCYACETIDEREMITCDWCSSTFHLDCLDPPLSHIPGGGSSGKKNSPWMCPLHAENDLKHYNTVLRKIPVDRGFGISTHRQRRIKDQSSIRPALRRGIQNTGNIEVTDVEDAEEEFSEHEDDAGYIFRLPGPGIELDFISKMKIRRENEALARAEEANIAAREAARLRNQTARIENDISQRTHERINLAYENERLINQDLIERTADEREAVRGLLSMTQDTSEVDDLTRALRYERAEDVLTRLATRGNDGTSTPGPLPEESRTMLLRMQQLIQQRLDESYSSSGQNNSSGQNAVTEQD